MTHDPARKKNDLRSLIEEARELATEALSRELLPSRRLELIGAMQDKFAEALALLPDADESASNWQEFDAEKKETWPPNDETVFWQVTFEGAEGRHVSEDCFYDGSWHCAAENFPVVAYQSLPSPYVKP